VRRSILANHYLISTGHIRSKNGVASLAYDPVVHADLKAAWIARSSPAMTKYAAPVMPGFMPGIHVFLIAEARRGWPEKSDIKTALRAFCPAMTKAIQNPHPEVRA